MKSNVTRNKQNGKLIFKSIERVDKTKRGRLDELNHLISLAEYADDQEWKEELEQERELLKQTEEDQS